MTIKDLQIANEENKAAVPFLKNSFVHKSISENTKKAYLEDWKIFTQWCAARNYISLPASVETVREFLIDQANSKIERRRKGAQVKEISKRDIKPSTLVRRLASIRWFHELKGEDSPTQDKIIRLEMQGIKKEKGMSRDKKNALTNDRISDIVSRCPDTLTGNRDKALLLLGFAGAFRRSELIALERKDIEKVSEGIKVTIRKSKSDQESQGKTIAIPSGKNLGVIEALYKWLDDANIQSGFIFRPIARYGHVQSRKLSTRFVADLVKQYVTLALEEDKKRDANNRLFGELKIENFSGHSLRRGFITSAAMNGASLFKLMEVSRHKKPETVMEYIQEAQLFEDHAGKKFL